eukprot:75736_1
MSHISISTLYLFVFSYMNCHTTNKEANITLYPTIVSPWKIPIKMESVSVEFTGHQLYGGFYSQMIFGESFEELEGIILPPPMLKTIQNEYNPNLYIQSCGPVSSEQLYATQISTSNNRPNGKFLWQFYYPAINLNQTTISIQRSQNSRAFTQITNSNNVESTRIGIKYKTNSWPPDQTYINEASFILKPGISGTKNTFSFQANNASKYNGYYMTINNKLSGDCANEFNHTNASDIIFISNPNNLKMASWYSLDYNYSLQSRNYYGCGNGRTNDSNLVNGISKMWMAFYEINNNTFDTQLLQKYKVYSLIVNKNEAFNGNQFQRLISVQY